MHSSLILLVAALCIAQVFSAPTSKAFTATVNVIEKDGSSGKMTWSYDAKMKAEHIVFHRETGLPDTTYLRLYANQMEYLVLEGTCYAHPLTERSLPPVSVRLAQFSDNKAALKWESIVDGPIDSSLLTIPSSCPQGNNGLEDGLFCPTCLAVGNQVIALGCNATSTQISNLCGSEFAAICKLILQQACTSECQMVDCAAAGCCFFGLCSGDTCNSTNSTSSSSSSTTGSMVSEIFEHEKPAQKPIQVQPPKETQQPKVGDGIFCSTCLSVSEQVVNLGCNATSTQISSLCGNLFASVCKAALETLCDGSCTVLQCPTQACCALDLCSGSTCNSTAAAVPKPAHVKLNLGN